MAAEVGLLLIIDRISSTGCLDGTRNMVGNPTERSWALIEPHCERSRALKTSSSRHIRRTAASCSVERWRPLPQDCDMVLDRGDGAPCGRLRLPTPSGGECRPAMEALEPSVISIDDTDCRPLVTVYGSRLRGDTDGLAFAHRTSSSSSCHATRMSGARR